MSTDHDRIETILIHALEIQSDSERRKYLDEECGSDEELRSQVEQLIYHHRQAGNLFRGEESEVIPPMQRHEREGDSIGPYVLLEKIGEGGFGLVFRAEQQTPIRRQVALKIVKPGMDSSQILARFDTERQALAIMEHMNIARVLDCGQSASGLPYFAMELIDGLPITEYCDAHRLPLRARLELFLPVCRAIQHAHQKGIIHRDLKPSNVLVAMVDGRPIPKVIDFGVAKAIGMDAGLDTTNTQIGTIIGTLEYMSPEQAVPGTEGIDTRSDIYCLGVLLYELLTGTTPLQRTTLKVAALAEILRIVREVDPPTPSSRLSAIEELPSVAANRGVEPRTLSHVVKGDLDWIVMKSLEKERDRRYSTANGLTRDIERFLSNEPVEAGPHGKIYKFKKFLRRNRGGVIVGSLLLLSLIGGVVGTSIGLVRAQQGRNAANESLQLAKVQRDRAERHYLRAMSAVDRLLTRVGKVQLESVPHMDETRRQILNDALEVYQEILKDEKDNPVVHREVGRAWQRVGDIQSQLGQHELAAESQRQAIHIQQRLMEEHPSNLDYENDYVRSNRHLAFALHQLGQYSKAELLIKEALSREANDLVENRLERFRLSILNGMILVSTQRGAEAISLFREALVDFEDLRSDPTVNDFEDEQAIALAFLGNLYRDVRKLDEAEKCLFDCVVIWERILAAKPSDLNVQSNLASARINLGLTYANLERNDEAIAIYGQAITLLEALERDHPEQPNFKMMIAKTVNNVCLIHSKNKDPKRAGEENVKVLKAFEQLRNKYPKRLEFILGYIGSCANQGKYLGEQGQWEESIVWNTKSIEAAEELLQLEPRHTETRRTLHGSLIGRAGRYRQLNQPDLAQADYRRSLEYSEGETHRDFVNFRPRALSYVGDHAKAAAEAEAIIQNKNATSSNFSEMAKVFATCADAAQQNASITEAERSTIAERYAVRSIELLKEAAEKGHFRTLEEVSDLRTTDRLQSIRDRDDFKAFVEDLEATLKSRD